MFRTASYKLTGAFLAIIMSITLTISVMSYISASSKANFLYFTYLPRLQKSIPVDEKVINSTAFSKIMEEQYNLSLSNLLTSIVFFNALILFGGGALFFVLSRLILGRIEKIYAARSQFASNTSHALRTPLANIQLETEVTLNNSSLSMRNLRDQLYRNLDEIERLKSLSSSLLKLSAMDSSGLEFKRIDLSETVKETVKRYEVNEKNRVIIKNIPSKPLSIKGNDSSIDELTAIFINNALKYGFKDKPVEIELRRKSIKRATLSIVSMGKPIPRDKLKYIFERFYRVEDAYGGENAGLGLALAKELASVHKAKIKVSSNDNGRTEFKIDFPLCK